MYRDVVISIQNDLFKYFMVLVLFMRKDFEAKPHNELEKIYVGCKLPFYLVKKMEKYHPKCRRSQFIEAAIVERMANLDYQKEIEKSKKTKS